MIRPLHVTLALLCSVLSLLTVAQNVATGSPALITTSSSDARFDWANPDFAKAKDNQMASVVLTTDNIRSKTFNAYNFGFQSTNSALPNYIAPNAKINGIVVSVTSKKSLNGDASMFSIRLTDGTKDFALTRRSNWTSTTTTTDFGTPLDTWGASFNTESLINPSFGVTMIAESKTKEPVKVEIDHIAITVYYNLKVYYSKSSGDLETLSTWGDHHTGSGAANSPTSFTAPGQVFIINNRSSYTLKRNFALTGANTFLVAGNGSLLTLTIPTLFSLNAKVMVADNATLDIQNSITPNIVSTGFNSTVIYNNTLNQDVSPINYYNLTLTGLGTKTIGAKSIAIENNLIINSGATLRNSGFDVAVEGIKEAIVNNGNAYGTGKYVYQATRTDTKLKGTGKFDNLEINVRGSSSGESTIGVDANTTILNTLKLSNAIFDNGSKIFMTSGSLLQILDGSVKGDLSGSSNFDIEYIMYAATTKITSNELTGFSIRHVTLSGVSGAQLVLNRALALNGNLIINEGELDASIYNYSITIKGNLSGTGSINSRGSSFTLGGTTKQLIQLTKAPSFYSFTIDNPQGAELMIPVTITGQISFKNGILYTSSTNLLIIAPGATAKEGTSLTYVDGPIRHLVNTQTKKPLLFPVGKNNLYKPVLLDIAQKTNSMTSYTGEFKLGAPIERALPKDVVGFFNQDRYYTVNCSNNANVDSAVITLTYDWYDNIINSGNLAIVKSNGEKIWKNVKGTKIGEKDSKLSGITKKTGTIASATFYSFSDFRFGESGHNPNGATDTTGTADQRTLPLKWVSVAAKQVNNMNEIAWQTADEVATNGFVVEKSTNAANWKEIAKVASNNREYNSYSVTDALPDAVNYYRIKQIDLDGKSTYSKTVNVKYTVNATANLYIVPNPVPGTSFNCVINNKELLTGKELKVSIINSYGKVDYSFTTMPQKVIRINASNLKPGYYIISIQNGKNSIATSFIKK